MVLLATDIAARGLDFPTIDWVVQVRFLGGEGGNGGTAMGTWLGTGVGTSA